MKGRRRTLRWAAAVLLGGLGLAFGVVAGVGSASGGTAGTGQMPCDPDTCQPPPTTTATTTTTTTGTTTTTPAAVKQCADGGDNDGDGLADGNDPACSSPDDDDESDDPPLESYIGWGDTEFGRVDEGAVGTDGSGATIRCAWLGAERWERGIVSKGWSYSMKVHWCWNGRTVVSWTGWEKRVDDHIPFPVSLIYPLDWKIVSETAPGVGGYQTVAFAEAKVAICPVKLPVCFTWYPWLRFAFDAQGHARCQSDVKSSIPDCKA